MLYNIYTSISDLEFKRLQDRLFNVESACIDYMEENGFYVSESVKNNDALIINFIKNDDGLYGNIGLVFDDFPKTNTFSLGVTKSLDENGVRYFLKSMIRQNQQLNVFSDDPIRFFSECIHVYNSWIKDEVKSNGLRIPLG